MPLIWITGAHGFIGRHLASYLARQQHDVLGIGHGAWPSNEAKQWGISTWINGDLSASNLGQMRHKYGVPETIYHLAGGSSVGAAFINPNEDFTRTVVSTSALLEWMRQDAPDAQLVAVSSAAVYGAGHNGAIPEDSQLSPYSPYGVHKLMMEMLCRSYATDFGLQVVLPRLFSVYGPELKKQFLWDLCGKLNAGGPIDLGGSGKELRDWTHVADVVNGLGRAANLASNEALTLNLATGMGTSVHDIALSVISNWGGVAADSIRFNGDSRPGDPFSLVAETTRMNSLNIHCSVSIEKGSAEYVDWYKTINKGK